MYPSTLYGDVADRVVSLIEHGTFRPGDRLPSLRSLSSQLAVSINTVKEAYNLLETQRFLEARPQSGYYVRRQVPPLPLAAKQCELNPREVTMCRIYGEVTERYPHANAAALGIALPDTALLPGKRLANLMQETLRDHPAAALEYAVSPGLRSLREQIARHSLESGLAVSPDEIIITSGGSEAIWLAIMALCQTGDTIAVETPTYFNFLSLLVELGIKVVEIPSSASQGPDFAVLEQALRGGKLKAFLAIPNFNNPLGFCLDDSRKAQLVDLMERYGVPLIEDDIYGELSFTGQRPTSCKSLDRTGNVILVSSFSKTIAPGYRVGWIIPGKLHARIDRLKSLSTVGTASPNQLVLARYLETGSYDRHLRSFRRQLALQTGAMAEAVARHFPTATRVSRPAGGFVLWIELPEPCNTLDLFRQAVAEGIVFSPGEIFSASGRFGNCMRLNAGVWNPVIETAIQRIGELAQS